MLHQTRGLAAIQRDAFPVVTGCRNQHKMVKQNGDVVLAFAQWRNIQLHHVQPVVQVSTELAFVAELLQVSLGGGDNANIHILHLIAAQALHTLFFEHPQQLYLQGHGHAFQLIQEQSALVRILDFSDAALFRTGKGTGFVTEKLALDQILGHSTTVDSNEVVSASGAVLVDIAGQGILPRTGLTVQQDIGGNIQYRVDGRHHFLHTG